VALRGDQRDRPSPREHRAFAPGNGRDRNGPDDGARPRGPGSEQPPRETATGVGGETRFTVPGVKGEEARYAVKGTASDGRTRDAHPRCRRAPSLSAGETLRRAESSAVGRPVRDGKKHDEPQDRQQGETDLHGRRGTNRRGGAKPRGRHAGETGRLSPNGAAVTRLRGDGLSGFVRWRGDLWKPQERQSGRQVGPHGSGRDGKVGVKVRRGARARQKRVAHPIVGTSRVTVSTTEGRGGERRSQ